MGNYNHWFISGKTLIQITLDKAVRMKKFFLNAWFYSRKSLEEHSRRFYKTHRFLLLNTLPAISFALAFLISPLLGNSLYEGMGGFLSSQSASSKLEFGRQVERELGLEQSHRFSISLDEGQYLRVTVEQQGVDVILKLFGPDSKLIAEMNSPYGSAGTESLSMAAEAAGIYEVEIKASKDALTPGLYRLDAEGRRFSSQTDASRIEAERAFMNGYRLSQAEKESSQLAAIIEYEKALKNWHVVGETYEEVKTLYSIGEVNTSVRKLTDALDFYRQARDLAQKIEDRRSENYALGGIGFIYLFSDQIKAREHLNPALSFWKNEGDKVNQGRTLHNLGASYENVGDVDEALILYNQAFALRQELKDLKGMAKTLNSIGVIYDRAGQSQEAFKHYEQAISILESMTVPDSNSIEALGSVLNNKGYVYLALGDAEKALEYFKKAILLRRQINDKVGEVSTLLNMGYAYLVLGEPPKALEYYEQARSVTAIENNKWGEAYVLLYKGEAHATFGDANKAIKSYLPALKIFKQVPDLTGAASVTSKIGDAFASMGNARKALANYHQALSIWRDIRDPRGEASTLQSIARAERSVGNLAEALKRSDEAIKKIESLRANVISPELRSSYLASVIDYYDLNIDLLMQMHKTRPSEGYNARALQVSELARARALLESLPEARENLREGVDAKLLEQEQSLYRQSESKSQYQIQLMSKAEPPADRIAAVEKELASLSAQIKEIQEKIRAQSPRYAALTQPRPLSLKEIQQEVLDSDSLILEYALGQDRSYLWMVGQSEIRSYELPKREVIEAQAKRVYELESSREMIFPTGIAEYWREAAKLSRMILGPVTAHLGNKRLLIVPEGALQYISFSALPIADRQAGGKTRAAPATPAILLENHEIIYLPSASVLALLRQEMANRQRPVKMAAVFADPVFNKDDERVKAPESRPVPQTMLSDNLILERTFRDFKLEPLRYTRVEAEAITSMVGAENSMTALDFDASRTRVINEDLSCFKIVIFATHSLLNSKQPDLSAIALSLVNERGESQNGLLRLSDIYSLRLSADLVVLSACETALGKDIRGEGLTGLTRGFMYAGAARVVASLWKVRDDRTAELMKRFYEKMLKEGRSPAAALREAQLEVWRSKRNSPFYWAAFILQGEWKPF